MDHEYIDHKYIDHKYMNHKYIEHKYIEHNCIEHNYIGHYINHSYIGRSYIVHNRIGLYLALRHAIDVCMACVRHVLKIAFGTHWTCIAHVCACIVGASQTT